MRQKPAWYHITRIVAATVFLSVSGYLLSSSTTTLAILIGLSQSTIGLTLLSIATTLPEKLVAFKAGSKKQTGVLVANTVGSNVFLGTLVLGIVYLVRGEAAYDSENRRNSPGPLSMLPSHSPVFEIEGRAELADVLVMLSAALALWTMVWYGKLRRWMGVAMLVAYVAYLVSVVLRSKL
jgi:Ca2+/Na+ antiporter